MSCYIGNDVVAVYDPITQPSKNQYVSYLLSKYNTHQDAAETAASILLNTGPGQDPRTTPFYIGLKEKIRSRPAMSVQFQQELDAAMIIVDAEMAARTKLQDPAILPDLSYTRYALPAATSTESVMIAPQPEPTDIVPLVTAGLVGAVAVFLMNR